MNIPELFGLSFERSVALADADATRHLGEEIGARSERGDFLGLIGNLGAGKTTFMQGFVTGVDGTFASEDVSSPTYTLLNTYATQPPVYHFDLYRLEHVDDLESVAYWETIEGRGISCVEWLDQIPHAWPPGHTVSRRTVLLFETEGEGRKVSIFVDT